MWGAVKREVGKALVVLAVCAVVGFVVWAVWGWIGLIIAAVVALAVSNWYLSRVRFVYHVDKRR